MKQSVTMAYADGFAKSICTSLKDSKIRCIYYFMGIISSADYKPSDIKYHKEVNDLKKYLSDLGYHAVFMSELMKLSKIKVKEQESKDDFFVLVDEYLKKAEQLAIIEKSKDVKAIHLLKVILNENFYWLDSKKIVQPNVAVKPVKLEDKIPLAPAKAFILSFYDMKHFLSTRMHIACNGKGIILGRNLDNDILFDEKHSGISRKHCMITCFKNHYYLEDLGSTQGTYVNDILIGNGNVKSKYIELKHNDVIKLANEVKIVVSLTDISKMKQRKCMACQSDFFTDKDEDICGICNYEFARDFDVELTINEVDFIPRDFSGIQNKLFNKKVETFNGSDCNLVFEIKKPEKIEEKPVKNDKPIQPVKEANDIIPGYEFIQVIGEGGMGKVYLVKERSTGKKMALKTMKADSKNAPIMKERFEREAYIQEQMNHKYIAKHYGHGEYNGMQYILMEYYAHGTILDYVKMMKDSSKQYGVLKDLLIQILHGLDYIHHATLKVKVANGKFVQTDGIVHRDIKPQNIFVQLDAKGNPTIKIADFGLSKSYQLAGETDMTETGAIMGTFSFMPRQQLINTKYALPEVDIWAAVAIIYYLCTGKPPKPFEDDKDAILTCSMENPVPIKNRVWLFPSKFAKIIDCALYDDCETLYYQQASDLIKDLLNIKV